MAQNETQPDLDQIEHYDYDLPKSLIAQEPLANREDARLMWVDRTSDQIDHWHIRDLDRILEPGDCLVLNNTRVIPAKLVGQRESTGGRWQGLVLETDENGNWRMLAKTRGHIKPGETVELVDRQGRPAARLVLLSKMDDGSWVGHVDPTRGYGDPEAERELTPQQWLERIGRVPLPHYIRGGNMVDADVQNYQTVFAREPGAVAAPTAGLHFTERLMNRLIDRGVRIATVTLHVGIGTFQPVKAERLSEHTMHEEYGEISQATAEQIHQTRESGGRVIAVGTTSVRVLETAAANGSLSAWTGRTDLFIRPGFEFKAIDGLLTNFHLPRSTLLVLVRTFGGDERIRRAYELAIQEKYRFFSYGDAMLIT